MIFIARSRPYRPRGRAPEPADGAAATAAARRRAGSPRRARGGRPSPRSARAELARAERVDERDVIGLVDGAALARVVAPLEAAPELALARALDRRRTSAARAGCGWRRRSRDGGRSPRPRTPRRCRRAAPPSRQRRISSKSRVVAHATTSGSDLRLDQPPRRHHVGRADVVDAPAPCRRRAGRARRRRARRKVPRPTSREMRPSASSTASAWRTIVRVTPRSAASWRSVGSRPPGGGPPALAGERISSARSAGSRGDAGRRHESRCRFGGARAVRTWRQPILPMRLAGTHGFDVSPGAGSTVEPIRQIQPKP